MNERFSDRTDAGRQLATALSDYAGRADVRILALPRGGVPVAYEVACALDAPLDIILVRKLGLPGHEELAMGAIASGGVMVLNQELVRTLNVSSAAIDAVVRTEMRELERRERRYRDDRPAPDVAGRTAIVVDDGLATGSTMQAAVAALKQEYPKAIVVAVPVAAPEICAAFRRLVDDVVCVLTPEPFHAVGIWYDDFSQTTDEEVHQLLAAARDCIHANTNTGLSPMRMYNESR